MNVAFATDLMLQNPKELRLESLKSQREHIVELNRKSQNPYLDIPDFSKEIQLDYKTPQSL